MSNKKIDLSKINLSRYPLNELKELVDNATAILNSKTDKVPADIIKKYNELEKIVNQDSQMKFSGPFSVLVYDVWLEVFNGGLEVTDHAEVEYKDIIEVAKKDSEVKAWFKRIVSAEKEFKSLIKNICKKYSITEEQLDCIANIAKIS